MSLTYVTSLCPAVGEVHNRLTNYRAYNSGLLSSGHTQLISSLLGSLSDDQLLEFERYFHLVCSAIARRVLSP